MRLRWWALFGCVAIAVRCAAGAPADKSVEGVAAFLGQATGGTVSPEEFVWEASGGLWSDAFIGRPVLFLAAPEGGLRDLYRARVRMGREGRPVSVFALRNLTATPLGDESRLTARGHRAAFATTASGALQGVTVLDLQGFDVDALPLGRRLMAYTENWLHAGSFQGLARTEVVFNKPPESLAFELRDELLVLALGDARHPAALNLADPDAVLNTGASNDYRAEAWTIPSTDKPFAHFAIDTLRDIFGTEAGDTLKAWLFDARSQLVRYVHPPVSEAERSTPLPAPGSATPAAGWPPARIAPLFKHPLEHEGEWLAPAVDWLPAASGGGETEPYLVETSLRPDPDQPFALVRMVAMDTRQLDLGIEAGYDEPTPLTGPRGRGRIPSDKRERVVAAFNGAFQTKHGEYGMVVDRRVLLPPKPYAASVAVDDSGRAYLGSWGASGVLPPFIASLRQNLDPLIEDGVVNPRGRTTWGFALDGAGLLTERSALCLTRSGHLVYAWGMETDAETVARALLLADCVYALHLDMNPGHVGFVYQRAGDGDPHAELLAREMSIAPRRYLEASPKDFFYLMLRATHAPAYGEVAWQPDGGAQPMPRTRVAIHAAKASRLGVDIELTAFNARRFEWRIVPGTREVGARTSDASLEPVDQARALAALSLGASDKKKNPRGLVLGGIVALPIREDFGVLVTSKSSPSLDLVASVSDMEPEGDASELVLLAEDGVVRSEARHLGARRRRSAACLLPDGVFVVALSTFDSAQANTETLMSLGCRRVVLLDRGKQSEAFVHRAGSETPPLGSYDDSALYALAIGEPGTAASLAHTDLPAAAAGNP